MTDPFEPFIFVHDPRTNERIKLETPEQYAEFQADMAATKAAEDDALWHECERFINQLSDEDAKVLHHFILTSMKSEPFGFTLLGRITQLRTSRFNICAACGKNHDEIMEHMLDAPVSEAAQQTVLQSPTDAVNRESGKELLERYNMEVNPEFVAGNSSSPIRCKGCGLTSRSLTDRMLKEPDDCEGCRKKAAWG